jgi:hypothetical protein
MEKDSIYRFEGIIKRNCGAPNFLKIGDEHLKSIPPLIPFTNHSGEEMMSPGEIRSRCPAVVSEFIQISSRSLGEAVRAANRALKAWLVGRLRWGIWHLLTADRAVSWHLSLGDETTWSPNASSGKLRGPRSQGNH